MNQSFGSILSAARQRLSWTQSDLAAKSGVSVDTIRGWEQERYEPNFPAIVRLLSALRQQSAALADFIGLPRWLFDDGEVHQLHTALDLILERAPKTVRDKIADDLTRLAGKYGGR